jgi:hypothetical protein
MYHLLDQNQGHNKPSGQPSTESTSQETDCRDIDRETVDEQGTHEQCDQSSISCIPWYPYSTMVHMHSYAFFARSNMFV